MRKAILTAKGLCKSFTVGQTEQRVLKGIDLEIYEGDFTIIMGSSGAEMLAHLDDSQKWVTQLENALEQNIRQLEVIKTSDEAQDRAVYYEGMKQSLQNQIDVINGQLEGSYSQAIKDYYQFQAENCDTAIRRLETQIENCEVKAPADSVITTLFIDKSNRASAEMPLATLSTGFKPLIEVYAPTSEIGSVHLQDMVEPELKVVSDGTLKRTAIEIEREFNTEYAVSAGLSEGALVVTDATLPKPEDGRSVKAQ